MVTDLINLEDRLLGSLRQLSTIRERERLWGQETIYGT